MAHKSLLEVGIEPTRPFGPEILSLVRLPITSLELEGVGGNRILQILYTFRIELL